MLFLVFLTVALGICCVVIDESWKKTCLEFAQETDDYREALQYLIDVLEQEKRAETKEVCYYPDIDPEERLTPTGVCLERILEEAYGVLDELDEKYKQK